MKNWGSIKARSLIDNFIGEIDGIVFVVKYDPGTYWDPPDVSLEYLEGEEFLPDNDDELEKFEDMLLECVNTGDYLIPETVQEECDRFLEWERSLAGEKLID